MSIYRVTVKADFASTEDQFNVHHYEFPNYIPTDVELQEFCDNLASVYEELYLVRATGEVSYNTIEVRRVDVGDLPSAEIIPTGWPVVGTNSSGSLPPQIAPMLRWSAPEAFPRSGRCYLQTPGKDQCGSGGVIVGALKTAMDTMALAMEEIEVTGQVDAQKVAVTYGGDPRAVIASNILFARPSRFIFQTQRRRTFGVGS